MESLAQSRASGSEAPTLPASPRVAPRLRGLAVLALVLALLPFALVNAYFYDVAILVCLNAIVCVGLNLLIGYAGQISLGHAGFFGLGAYGSALLAANWGVPPFAALLLATAAVSLLAFVVGRPILRLKGNYLAMATLGLGIIIAIVLANEDGVTGALHGSEVAAEVVGVDSAGQKVMVFVLSAAFAAAAGGLTAFYSGFITPSKASFMHSVELVTMVVFGGMASTFGAVVGAAVLTVLPQALTVVKEYEMVVLGAVMMVTMIFFPRGAVPTLAARFGRRSR